MISEEYKTYRDRIIDYLNLLSSVDEQREYQKSVEFINVPDELLCMWFDDLNIPAGLKFADSVLTASEIKAIEVFSGKFDKVGDLIRKPNEISLEELLESPDWKNLMAEAFVLLQLLEMSQMKLTDVQKKMRQFVLELIKEQGKAFTESIQGKDEKYVLIKTDRAEVYLYEDGEANIKGRLTPNDTVDLHYELDDYKSADELRLKVLSDLRYLLETK